MYVYVGTCAHLCVKFSQSAIHGPIFWTNKNMKKGELYCINVANYVHKVVFYDNTVLELKKKTWELCRWVCLVKNADCRNFCLEQVSTKIDIKGEYCCLLKKNYNFDKRNRISW